MTLTIDKDILSHQELTPSAAFYLLSQYAGSPITSQTVKDCYANGYIFHGKTDNTPYLTDKGKDKVESLLLDGNRPKEEIDRFTALANRLRELYPRGRKPGTAYMWRDSASVIAKRLKAVEKKFDCHFTDEQAITATRRYIDSFNGDLSYMQLLKYFIFKQTSDGETTSQLLSYIENEGDADAPARMDYMTQMR